ncbi:Nudix family hydrolase [Pseudoxanthomonas mexicana]|uniref:Nudix family hydrolase n=1 Tax=Pseudoxanthomonas mexicana TaxID=128785 RepID=UPI00398AD13D
MSAEKPLRSIHVVAGIITDARGRILLSRRTEGRDLAGRWEFPGGKREPGETPEEALIRELQEELGITPEVGAAFINVPQLYPDKRLRLDVRFVTGWQGNPRGHEGQALAWVAPDKLPRYDMPPADKPVVAALLQPDRYLVTPEPGPDAEGWLAALETALEQGIRRVQLRARTLAGPAWEELARKAVARCRQVGVDVLINGDIALAQALETGVHLRAAQLPALAERPLPAGLPVAASCHDVDELRQAQALGCDFALLGTLKTSASHPGRTPLGWEGFATLREAVSLPIYAIGGLSPDDLDQARQHGAQGVAAIRALWPVEATVT